MSHSLERKSVQKMEGFGVEQGKLAQKVFYISVSHNFTLQCDIRGIEI